MRLNQEKRGGVGLVAPVGRVDSVTSLALEEAVQSAIAAGERRVVVDFSGVEYISSAGLRVLLVAAKRLRELQGSSSSAL